MQARILEIGSKRVGFGSQSERKTDMAPKTDDIQGTPKKKPHVMKEATSCFNIKTYE